MLYPCEAIVTCVNQLKHGSVTPVKMADMSVILRLLISLTIISTINCMAVRSSKGQGGNETKSNSTSNSKPITLSSDADDLHYDICEKKDDLVTQREFSLIKCLSKTESGLKCVESITQVNHMNSPGKFRNWFCEKNTSYETNYDKLQTIGTTCRANISTELESVVTDCEVEEDARLVHIDICINKNEDTVKARYAVIKCTIEIGGKNGTDCVEKTLELSPPPSNHTAFAKWYCDSHNITSEHATGVSDALIEDCEFADPTWVDKIEECVNKFTDTLEESSNESSETNDSGDDSTEESADEPIAVE